MARMWTCGLCVGFASLLLSQMLSHLRLVHSDDDNFRITCGILDCDKSYNKYDSFYRHVKSQHHAFLEIPTTHLGLDISTALRPSNVEEERFQERCPEKWQVKLHSSVFKNKFSQRRVIINTGGGRGGQAEVEAWGKVKCIQASFKGQTDSDFQISEQNNFLQASKL